MNPAIDNSQVTHVETEPSCKSIGSFSSLRNLAGHSLFLKLAACLAAAAFFAVAANAQTRPTSISISPQNPTVQLGQTVQFSAQSGTTLSLGEITKIATGYDATCALLANGTVRCWGNNSAGQLGNGTVTGSSTPVIVSGLSGVVDIAAASQFACALLADGTVQCWGNNSNGQLGNGTTTNSSTPVSVSSLSGATAISSGKSHTCTLLADGTAKCWGNNSNGQLGDGTTTNGSTPVVVSGLNGATGISAGQAHTCAVLDDGTVKCWGNNSNGQLGDGSTTSSGVPVTVSGLSGAVAISGGQAHTCALLADRRTVQCWGRNDYGQLGDGTNTNSSTPVSVIEPAVFGSANLYGVTALASRDNDTCALLSGYGYAACWGNNSNGQLGDGTTTSSSIAVLVTWTALSGAKAVDVGGQHACAVLPDGTAKCWGGNSYGQLGDGTLVDRYVPVTVAGGNALPGSGASHVGAGWTHTCVAISDGTAQCWGDNSYGQLGNGTTTSSSTPVLVSGLTGVVQIANGANHSCALISDGTVKCWGNDSSGQVGSAWKVYSAVAIAAGGDQSCVLTYDGHVNCWGYFLGHGLPPHDVGVNAAVAIAVGQYHACALLSDRTVQCLGDGTYGQLGDGISGPGTTSPVPVTVLDLTGAAGIAAGMYYTCAVMFDGTARCWGHNGSGQLGDGTTSIRSTAVLVSGLGSVPATAMAAGERRTCALLADGTVKCWGNNKDGLLGNGTTSTTPSGPVLVSGLNGATAIAAGYDIHPGSTGDYNCALLSDGTVKCWGYNASGQLGDGTTTNRNAPVATIPLVPSLSWSSDTTSVATIDSATGLATAVAHGTATITATYGSVNASTTLMVNTPPTVSNVQITGTPTVGQLLMASYTYSDPDEDSEGTSAYQWLRDGNAISGATSSTYTTVSDDAHHTITFQVTPVAATGASPGATATSPGVYIYFSVPPPAGALTVLNTNDSGPGSLRAAIAAAPSGGGGLIDFDLAYPAVITLSSTLAIAKNLAISGPGASNLAVDGNNAYQVFTNDSGKTVSISGLTIQNGKGIGGGIHNGASGTLALADSIVSGHSGGPAIYNYYAPATMTITNTTVSGNSGGSFGGGIHNLGTLTLTHSIVSGNSNSAGTNGAGGIYNYGTITVTDSSISGNHGYYNGGGIRNGSDQVFPAPSHATLINTTVSGNSSYTGGGISQYGGTLTLINSTVIGNSPGGLDLDYGTAALNNSTIASNSGVNLKNGEATVTFKNTLLAKGSASANCDGGQDAWSLWISQGYNISDDTSCVGYTHQYFLTATGDLNNTPAGLYPNGLQDNGGPTKTIALLGTSPAANAIPTDNCTDTNGSQIATDQRGITRPQGSRCEIGAVEMVNYPPSANNVSISGSPHVGQVLTGQYTYFDLDGDQEGTSTFRWLRDGSTVLGTGPTYTAVLADSTHTITFEVTPLAATGVLTGFPVTSAGVAIVNLPPTARDVSISGSPYVGQVLTGHYTYSDAENDGEGTSTFRWLRGTTPISGATSMTYTLVAADSGKSITFEVTPVAATGTSPGLAVRSDGITILNSAPTATEVSITGTPNVRQLLTGYYTYHDVDGNAQGTSTFRWLRDGIAISGATSSAYTVVLADLGKTITFEVIPVAATGASPGTAATSSGVLILNSAPTASGVSITGMPYAGQQLTGHYTYNDVDDDAQGTSTFRWLRDGSTVVGTSLTYTVVVADLAHTITFEVTPVAATGMSPGTAVASAGLTILNSPPTASNVGATGTALVGQLLTGYYAYGDVDSDAQGTSTFRWLRDGSAVSGATSPTYTTVANDVLHTITFEVTPVARTGASPGAAVTSPGVFIFSFVHPAGSLTVINVNDSGPGSLRDAIATASSSGGTVDFDLAPLATITLSSTLNIASNVTISGPGASNLTVSGNNAVGVFTIASGATVSISGLTIANGAGSGSHISGDGQLVLDYVGGDVSNGGVLTLTNCTVSNNLSGPGIINAPTGTLTVTNCTISGNSNPDEKYAGGGIFSLGDVTLTNSTVSGNSNSTGTGSVGGIFSSGTLIVTASSVSGNSAGGFGGILSSGTATLTNVTVSNNVGENGGGIGVTGGLTPAVMTVINSTVSGNTSLLSPGGAFQLNGRLATTLTIISSTVVGNTSIASGTGGYNGAIYGRTFQGTLTIKNSILANGSSGGNCLLIRPHTAPVSGGYNISDDDSCSSVVLYADYKNDNTGVTTPFLAATGDLNNTSPGLDADGLKDNGGPTKTIALLPTSIAANAIPAANCTDADGNPLTTDQRGISRPRGPACDIGAVELTNVAPKASGVSIGGTPNVGQVLTGQYTYYDADGDAEGTSTFRWLRDGHTLLGTNRTYTVVLADLGDTITFEVTPVAAIGSSPGFAVTSGGLIILNSAPTASNVSITGTALVGQVLTGLYRYADADGDAQGTSTYRWLRDGSMAVGTSSTYTTVSDDLRHAITFEVTPVAAAGTSPGAAVTSPGVPILSSVPAAGTTTVFNTNDSGFGSLRDAIATASVSGGTVNFDLVYPATITLSTTLNIAKSLTISGPGASNLAVSGNNEVVVFSVAGGTTVSISGLTIANGAGSGGNISNGSTLNLTDSTVSGNSSGPGIYNTYGGGNSFGSLTLTNSTVSGNSNPSFGGGIFNNAEGGEVVLINSTVTENHSTYQGGGIYVVRSLLFLNNSTVSGNSAGTSGGGIAINSGNHVNVNNSTISGNTSQSNGGGFYSIQTSPSFHNSTISGNSASDGGGIGYVNYTGGQLVLVSSTVAGNSGSNAASILSAGRVYFVDTILAKGSSGSNCHFSGAGPFSSGGYNISDDDSCSSYLTQTSDRNNISAGLDPNGLQDNGGPTKTIALLGTSPAVNAIPTDACPHTMYGDLAPDQRGIIRPQGPACDIGAFELVNAAPVASNVSISGSPYVGQVLTGQYTYSDLENDPQGTSTFRWLRDGRTVDGTSLTYTVVVADLGHAITFEVTPVAVSGVLVGLPVTSAGLTILNSAPTASSVSIAGTPNIGQVLTGQYTYADVDGDAQGTSTYRWLRGSSPMTGATSNTYTLVAADAGHSITFEVTPVAAAGISPGTAVTSSGVTINSPPVASNVNITGINQVTQTLTGNYSYNDVDKDPQGTSTFRWLRNGNPISGATGITYKVDFADLFKTITFEVTPVAATGSSPGMLVTSSPGVTIVDAPPVLLLNASSLSVQYTDAINNTTIFANDVDSIGSALTATMRWKKSTESDSAFQTTTPLGGLTLTSLSSNGTTIPGTHSWTLSGKALVAAATYVVRITVTDGLKPSSIDLTITVGQENAYIDYTGDTIAQVGTSLALRATVWDSAAAGYTGTNPETGTNATIGDITKMWIEFDIYPAASCGSVTPTILRAQVLDSGTLRDGIGTATASYKSSSEASFCVIPVLVASSTGGTNQYYVSTLGGEAAGLDFYVNTGQFATGGGWISDPTGSKGNFGFNARYANNNSPKGQLVYVYRGMYNGVPADFIIKSNALNGLKFSTGNYPITATLQGKANIQINQASNGAQLYGDGNATFSITATDSGQTTTGDALSLTVYDKNAVPYKTIVTSALKGGNLVVHNK